MIIDEIRRLHDEVRDTMHNLGMKAVGALCNLKLHSKRREAASHLLVFMVSDEQHSSKPYAIPIRALPFKSITDDH